MEQRIKIVWIFSIASILLITCGQVYWLRNQYQYMNDEQINGIYDCILQTTQQYDSIRTPQPKKVLSNTNMFFYHLSKSIDLEKRTTIDELILGVLKGRDLESLGQKNIETLKIEQQDSASTDDKEREAKRRKWALALDTLLPEERLIAKDSFKINMSDKDAPNLNSIINLYVWSWMCLLRCSNLIPCLPYVWTNKRLLRIWWFPKIPFTSGMRN